MLENNLMKKIFFRLPIFVGSLFFLSCSDNEVTDPHDLAGVPFENLSEYEFFKGDMANLTPSAKMIGFDLTTPLFTDFAQKKRFLFVPDGETVAYNPTDFLEFPIGSMLVKNFYYAHDLRDPAKGKKIIETRVLVHFPDGWDAFTYLWNPEQTEGFYSVVGKSEQVSFINEQGTDVNINYVVPNKNDCKGCHNINNAFVPIGPKARYLNREYDYEEGTQNILTKLSNDGVLTGLPALEALPEGVVWDDPTTGTLEERARTYLDINCAHCHRSEGPANHSGLFLNKLEEDPYRLGFCKTPVAAGNGSGGLEFDIVPADAEKSILHYRMNSTDPGVMMPELGRSINHDEGIQVIRDWINSLEPGDCN